MTPFDEAMLIAKHIADVDESPMELVKQLHRGGLLAGPSPVDITLNRANGVTDCSGAMRAMCEALPTQPQDAEEFRTTWVFDSDLFTAEVTAGDTELHLMCSRRDPKCRIENITLEQTDAQALIDLLTSAVNYIKEHKE